MRPEAESTDSAEANPNSKKPGILKVMLFSLGISLFPCCVLPSSCLYITAPVTWYYEDVTASLPAHNLELHVFLSGENDFHLQESGPRRVCVGASESGWDPSSRSFRILDVGVAIGDGEFAHIDPAEAFPALIEPEHSRGTKETSWFWASQNEFDIEPSSGTPVRVAVKFEIISVDGTSIPGTYETEILPLRNRQFIPNW